MAEIITTDAVNEAAKKIEDDLQLRGLSKGERYISASDAGTLIGVSMATADRAMRALTDKGVLIRQRGRGTFVGPKAFENGLPAVQSIQIFMPRLSESLGVSLEDAIRGIHKVYPDLPVAINVFPIEDPLAMFRRMLAANYGSGIVGFGLILAPRIIQEEVALRKLPAVLLGTPFPGVKGLVSMDIDYSQLGELLVQDLLSRGHKRFAIIIRENVAPGDAAMLAGVLKALGAAGVRCDALQVRHSVLQRSSVIATVREVLSVKEPPTALIGYPFVDAQRWVTEAVQELDLKIGADFEYITGLAATSTSPESCPALCCVPPDEVGERFGRLLANVARGNAPEKTHMLLPVQLKQPRG